MAFVNGHLSGPGRRKGHDSVVSAEFDDRTLNIDSGGRRNPDLTVQFATHEWDYRFESSTFDGGTSSNGTDEHQQYGYFGSSKAVTEYDG